MQSSILVVGAGGLVGSTVVANCRSHGMPVLTSSHRAGDGIDFKIDLHKNGVGTLPNRLEGISHAVVCSAISKIDECFSEPEKTGAFNVTHTIQLLERLQQNGVVPVFCSSDAVFQGDEGNYREEDTRAPIMQYGRQKAAVEDYLLSSGKPFLILRFGKLVRVSPHDTSPVGGIVRNLSEGIAVKAAGDQYMSLTDVEDVTAGMLNLILESETGVWHLSHPEALTRLEMAKRISTQLGREELVEPVSIDDFDFLEPRPKNPVLNSERFRSRFDFTFSNTLADIERYQSRG